MATKPSNEAVTDATQATAPDTLEVVNLGDVSEPVVNSPLTGELIAIKPLKSLPKTHKHLASIYPGAKGFTQEESGMVALHF